MELQKTLEHSRDGDVEARQVQIATLNILEDFNQEKLRLEATQRAVLNILEDFDTEKGQLRTMQRATFNILEDFNAEKLRLETTQRAVLNILDDFDVEKGQLRTMQRATFNILEDFNAEKLRLETTQRAVLNILDDFDIEKSQLRTMQRATFNILEDFNAEKLRLEEAQKALLNILDDFDVEKVKVEQTNLLLQAKSKELNRSNEELQRAHAVLEIRVAQRTAELERSNAQLQLRTEELARSNAELEQFAYVASHDLQEPLRMVSSYVQLLAKRYRGRLDPNADDFINFAVDGAVRMQTMINDLLSYSSVTTRGKAFEETSLEASLSQALDALRLAIREQSAVITHDPLPSVKADLGQMAQLFQNLVENAIKFRGEQPPRIHISVRIDDNYWVCSVSDNGIGIDPQYFDRLFVIFQRLHTRDKYPGTGIGLALCKRIVERHGGKIWVESRAGQGSTFFFTIPRVHSEETA